MLVKLSNYKSAEQFSSHLIVYEFSKTKCSQNEEKNLQNSKSKFKIKILNCLVRIKTDINNIC